MTLRVEQAHWSCRPSHPYLLTPGMTGSGHVAHRTNSVEPGAGRHVLEAVQENMEFCPRDGAALAQHMVGWMEVVPSLVDVYRLRLRSTHGKTWRFWSAFLSSLKDAHVCCDTGDRMNSSRSSTTLAISLRSKSVKFSG